MPQLMHIPALFLLGSFSTCPSLPHENECFVDSEGKKSIQPYRCLQGCSDIAYRSSAGNCGGESICRTQARDDFRDLASPILLQIRRHVASAATSSALDRNPGMGHYVNTQPAGLENIRPLSCALEAWAGDTSPLKTPNITPFIKLLPKEPAPCRLGNYLDVTCMPAAGGLQGTSVLVEAPRGRVLSGKSSREGGEVAAGTGAPQRHTPVLATKNITAAGSRNSSLLLWLRSMYGSRSADLHGGHPASDT